MGNAVAATVNGIGYALGGLLVFFLIPFLLAGLEQIGGPNLMDYLMHDAVDVTEVSPADPQRVKLLALVLLAALTIGGFVFGVHRPYKPLIENEG